MIILFTLWYILGWQFPVWLWVVSGVMFLVSFSGKGTSKKKALTLPLSLALGLTYGFTADGASIILDGEGWTVFWIFLGSGIIMGSSISAGNSAKRKKKKKVAKINDVDIEDVAEDSGILEILITDNESGSKSRFKVNLSSPFFIAKFTFKYLIGKNLPGADIDLDELFKKAKENPIKGPIFTLEHEGKTINISVK